MTGIQIQQIVIAIVAPIITAAVGVLGLVIGDWRQRRTEAGRRKLAFEDASRQVSFAAEWVKATKLIAASPEAEEEGTARAAAWLDEASRLVAASKPPPSDGRPGISIQRLLLADPLRNRAARRLRTAFYLTLCLVPWLLGLVMLNFVKRAGVDRAKILVELAMLIVAVVLSVAFRVSAQVTEEAKPERQEPPRFTLRRALLLYRLHGAAAKAVRIVFYCWILWVVLPAIAVLLGRIEKPLSVPGQLSLSVSFLGYAVMLRFWAASLDERHNSNRRDYKMSSRTSDAVPVRPYGNADGPYQYAHADSRPLPEHGDVESAAKNDVPSAGCRPFADGGQR